MRRLTIESDFYNIHTFIQTIHEYFSTDKTGKKKSNKINIYLTSEINDLNESQFQLVISNLFYESDLKLV